MAEQGSITIGEFIAASLRKEILHIWLGQDPAPIDAEVVGALVVSWSPAIAEELIQLVKGWIPGLLLNMDSPLSAFRGDGGEDEVSLAVSYVAEPARLTISESLQSFFESLHFSADPPSGSALSLQPELVHRLPSWLISENFRLPADSVFCLSAGIGPVLLRAPRDESLLEDDAERETSQRAQGVDEDAGVEIGSPRWEVPRPPRGSKEETLTKRLQSYQRRIFRLERELNARSQSEKEKVALEKKERANAEARLMEINSQLEERLKARTEDLRKTGQKLVEAQRGMNHTKWLLEDKSKQISKHEYREEQQNKTTDDFKEQEKKLTKRLLRLAVQEDAIRQREEYRIDKLQGYLKGKEDADALSEANSNVNMTAVLEKMEDDFEVTFNKRNEKFESSLREYDRKLEDKRTQYNILNRDVQRMALASRRRAEGKGMAHSEAEQVTDLILNMESQDLLVLLQSEPQLKYKLNDVMERN